MDYFLYLLAGAGLLLVLFVIAHLRPLRPTEIDTLSRKRRWKYIQRHFAADNTEHSVSSLFKKRMNPTGRFYDVDIPLYQFPSAAAALLKYKKHEWVIVGFARRHPVTRLWINNGDDRNSVSLRHPLDGLQSVAQSDGFESVFILHNHPTRNAHLFDYSQPSDQDKQSAEWLA